LRIYFPTMAVARLSKFSGSGRKTKDAPLDPELPRTSPYPQLHGAKGGSARSRVRLRLVEARTAQRALPQGDTVKRPDEFVSEEEVEVCSEEEYERDMRFEDSPRVLKARARIARQRAAARRPPRTVRPILHAEIDPDTDCLCIVFRPRPKAGTPRPRPRGRRVRPRVKRARRRRTRPARGSPDDPDPGPEPELGPFTPRPVSLAETGCRPPLCDACHKSMRWNGTVEGWGCPLPGDPTCRSSLHRPKAHYRESWPLDERYPELAYG
jgi:hypothetical protein